MDDAWREASVDGAHDEGEDDQGDVQAVSGLEGDATGDDGAERLGDSVFFEADGLYVGLVRIMTIMTSKIPGS